MGASLGTGGGAVADINMTPLIDIVLVVLIIMMVNIPIAVERMGVKLPAENKPQTITDPPDNIEQLAVAIYEDGSIALNLMAADEEALFQQISRRLKAMDKKIVFIDAHPTLDWNTVIDMVDLVKEAGAEKVGFARLKPEGPKDPVGTLPGGLPRGVHPGSPGVVGAMTEKQAYTQFQPAVPAISACYDTLLATSPGASGRLLVRVDVGPQGEIMDSGIVSPTLEDEALHACILEVVPGLTYEPLGEQKTARVHYPLIFSPG